VAKTLGLKQKRRYRRQNENLHLLGVIGFDEIIGFLYKVSKNSLPPLAENAAASAQARSLEKGGASQNPGQEIPIKKVILKEIKVCDSSANGYSVSWNQAYTKAKIGDLFGIISEDKTRLEIAIIRRIALNTGTDFRSDFRFGAEVLGFESEIAYMSSIAQPSVGAWAIFIPGLELLGSADTLIFSIGGAFSRGDMVLIQRRNQAVPAFLLKELHSTVAISHMELSYPKK
jgi:cyclic-di-GMP-binding protein